MHGPLKKNQTYSIKRTGIMQRNKKLVGKARKTWSVCDITLNLADKSEQEASNLLAQTELVLFFRIKTQGLLLSPKIVSAWCSGWDNGEDDSKITQTRRKAKRWDLSLVSYTASEN